MSDRHGIRGPAVGSAADWYVDVDAEPADAAAAAELVGWLARDDRNEADYERCEAAVWLAARLENDPDLEWAFAEAESLARTPGAAPQRRPQPARRAMARRAAWAAAAGIAAVAVAFALSFGPAAPERATPALASNVPVAASSDIAGPPGLLDAPAPAGRSAISRALIDDAAATAPVVLPGEVVVDASSVAVLPFVNLTRNPADGSVAAYFDAGLAADLHSGIVDELGGIAGVQVVNRHAVMPYAGVDLPAGDVAAELGVRGIVRGGLRSEAGRVDVEIELVDAVDGRRLWSIQESRSPDELGAVRAQVAAEVAAALADSARRR